MKVIYNTCYADPWLKVAIKLQKDHGYEPVYWNGYRDDDSENLIPRHFPDAIYHPYTDSWKGIFPNRINKKFPTAYLDLDFLKDFAHFELQALKMMDRMDPDRYSFNFIERQRHFRRLLKHWIACVDCLKPDLVISAIVPHRVYDYALYLLCKHMNIKYVTFRSTSFIGRIIPITDVNSIGKHIENEYLKLSQSDLETASIENNVSDDILITYKKVTQYSKPYFMKEQDALHKESSGLISLTKKFFSDIRQYKDNFLGEEGLLKAGIPTYHKHKNKSIEDSKSMLFDYSIKKLKANSFKKKLKQHYADLADIPDFKAKYVCLTLHYQPEMTSNPSGDIFVDQLLCIEMLAKYLPSQYLIYVKEHPHQFFANREGHTSRITQFYEDIKEYPNVRLIPLDTDSFKPIRESSAVATITGTAGWEAMVLGKPVINFGLSWYESYKGVLKITNETTASKIPSFLENFSFDKKDLMTYLHAFSKKSFMAYYYRGLKQKMNQNEQECVQNLIDNILMMVCADNEQT